MHVEKEDLLIGQLGWWKGDQTVHQLWAKDGGRQCIKCMQVGIKHACMCWTAWLGDGGKVADNAKNMRGVFVGKRSMQVGMGSHVGGLN